MKNFKTLNSNRAENKQKGITPFTIILGLAISSTIIGGSASMFITAQNSANTARALDEVAIVKSQSRALYEGSGSYGTGSLLAPLHTSGALPQTLKTTESGGAVTAKNSWGGDVTVVGSDATFLVTYTEIPVAACVKIASSARIDPLGISVNGTSHTTNIVAVATATTQCAGTDPATLVWTFN